MASDRNRRRFATALAGTLALVTVGACGDGDSPGSGAAANEAGAQAQEAADEAVEEAEDVVDDVLDAAVDGSVDAEALAEAALESLRGEGNVLVVVLDGERYEFEGQYCVTMVGYMGQQTVGDVESGRFELPSEGSSETPWISLELGERDPESGQRTQWSAGGDETGMLPNSLTEVSQIDSYTITRTPSDRGEYLEDYFATGTATFVNVTEYWQSEQIVNATGTFEAACVD